MKKLVLNNVMLFLNAVSAVRSKHVAIDLVHKMQYIISRKNEFMAMLKSSYTQLPLQQRLIGSKEGRKLCSIMCLESAPDRFVNVNGKRNLPAYK